MTATAAIPTGLPAGNRGGSGRRSWVSKSGAYTFRRHWKYSLLEGVWQGCTQPETLSFIIISTWAMSQADESLYATLISGLPSIAMLTAPIWDRPWSRGRRFWIFMAFFARMLPGFAMAFVGAPWAVVAIVVFASVASSGQSPLQNSLFARNYTPEERERFHGLARLALYPSLVVTNFALSALMDWDASSFRWALPIAGVIAAGGMMLMQAVRFRRIEKAQLSRRSMAVPSAPTGGSLEFSPLTWARMGTMGIYAPYRRTMHLLTRNKDFALFELGFMLYGIGFMMLVPVIPVFYKSFDVDFKEFSFHTEVAFNAILVIGHFALRGRTSSWPAARVAGVAFTVFFGYPVLLLIAWGTHVLAFALLGFVVQGAAMVFIDYAWNYGPVRFARGKDATPYVTAHAMLVGARALIAFPASYAVRLAVPKDDYLLSFSIPAVLLLSAMASCAWLSVRQKRAAQAAELASQLTD